LDVAQLLRKIRRCLLYRKICFDRLNVNSEQPELLGRISNFSFVSCNDEVKTIGSATFSKFETDSR
jgi:hypothetical protein